MGLLSGLESFGLGKYKNAKVLKEEAQATQKDGEAKKVKTPKLTEEDCIYDKHYICPICDSSFTSKCVRAGKLKLAGKDMDLRPRYEVMDPLKYDVITCDKCGYSSLTRYYGKLTTRQMMDIRDEIGSHFSGLDNSSTIFSYEDAIFRFKLALVCAIVKNAKNSERGYLCLKMSWLYRGLRESDTVHDEEKLKQLQSEELECMETAYDSFSAALSKEPLPIAGMDENTVKYILAELARRLKKYEEAGKLVSSVIVSRQVSDRLKDQALTLREQIKAEMKSESVEQ
ncbi:MAG: DUF2225 domain-containing protein [Lachnospiraceae bacterium]|nr:DUF2225 domain-containing protein [Lachnospiraceae bacterium]